MADILERNLQYTSYLATQLLQRVDGATVPYQVLSLLLNYRFPWLCCEVERSMLHDASSFNVMSSQIMLQQHMIAGHVTSVLPYCHVPSHVLRNITNIQ